MAPICRTDLSGPLSLLTPETQLLRALPNESRAMLSLHLKNLKFHRAMIGTKDLRVDFCVFQLGFQCFRHEKIVDTPAGVLLPGMETIGPPGINTRFFRIKVPESIHKALFEKLRKPS